ncbi:MAG TPA: hydantoinase/carbamoylase family amidase, partial [Iamia sp.]|nr:hydantoinase/carbamoylase family amidase [Iamia sp.]
MGDDLRISWARLRGRLDALGAIGSTGDGGCARLALTDADREGRDLVVTWMRELGLRVDVDGVGNVTGTWPADSTEPPVLTGSHIDTVRTGGIYDGNLGVLAGLEAVETIITSGVALARPVAVAFFTNEEGARFAPDMFGSLVFVGGLPLEEALDTVGVDGAVVGDELERIGYVGPMPCPARPPAAFVELHIEQGPVLEAMKKPVGVVLGTMGVERHNLRFIGQAAHSGAAPIHLRKDAFLAAAEFALACREISIKYSGKTPRTRVVAT